MSNKEQRKQLILKIIENSENVQISEIVENLKYFEIDIDIRTIQRDLEELLEEKKISKSGEKKGVYYFVSKINKIFKEIDVEEYFKQDYNTRSVKENFDFDLFSLLTKDIFTEEEQRKLENLHNDFLTNFSKYESQTLINKEFERILIEFSWKSSAIEGNTYSLLSTEALIKENIKDETKTKEETQMILNHKDAFNECIQNKQRFLKIQLGDIEYLHHILTKNLGVAKNIRKSPVGIVGTKYKPLDNEFQIKEALEKMVDLVNSKKSFFEKSFLALILLSYIQAFEDGNKRTARMVSNAILLSFNSVPLSYRIVDIVEYKKASILFYETNSISYLKKIFIEQFEDSVNNYFR